MQYLEFLDLDYIYTTYKAVLEEDNKGSLEGFEKKHLEQYYRLKIKALKGLIGPQ